MYLTPGFRWQARCLISADKSVGCIKMKALHFQQQMKGCKFFQYKSSYSHGLVLSLL